MQWPGHRLACQCPQGDATHLHGLVKAPLAAAVAADFSPDFQPWRVSVVCLT